MLDACCVGTRGVPPWPLKVRPEAGADLVSLAVAMQKIKDHVNPHLQYERKLVAEGTITEGQVLATYHSPFYHRFHCYTRPAATGRL